eukprot:TRINITY_DN12001_c0_g1_i1.p1 TRINITY_DN12001_c0_g1~~TRINITY_DN12001_c0_g1_i1.p1  ORF type:complete len:429 (+),score=63.12 TRINITY_DN12001_c0_g1_i1:106-1287(+)
MNNTDSTVHMMRLAHAQFIFCLFQSFQKLPEKIVAEVTHIVLDEVHHILAHTYKRTFEQLLQNRYVLYILGMTATLLHKRDPTGAELKRLFDGNVFVSFDWTKAKACGFFPRVEYIEVLNDETVSTVSLEEMKTEQFKRDYAYAHILDRNVKKYLSGLTEKGETLGKGNFQRAARRFISRLEACNSRMKMTTAEQVRNVLSAEYVVGKFIAYQKSLLSNGHSKKKRTVMFVMSCEEANRVAQLLNKNTEMKIRAGVAHYKKEKSVAQLKKFQGGGLDVLVTVMMVNEGYDCAKIDCVVLARLTDSEIVYVQQIGRGLRRDPDDPAKSVCILDLAYNLRRRWKRLHKELPHKILIKQILSFWPVHTVHFPTEKQYRTLPAQSPQRTTLKVQYVK